MPMLPSCLPVSEPTASMIWHITKGTMPIWIKRKKISPRNLISAMAGPPMRPATTPAIMAMTMARVALYLKRLGGFADAAVMRSHPRGNHSSPT